MCPRLRFAEIELSSAANDLAAKFDEMLEDLLEVENLRLAVDDRDVDDAERRLHRRQLVEFVEDDLRDRVAFQLDDDAHSFAVRFVADLGDAVKALFVDELGDLFDQTS